MADREEFFVICSAPVRVGGGIVRHYIYPVEGRISVRYSFGGVEGDNVVIEKLTTRSKDNSSVKELILVPVTGGIGSKKGQLVIGKHSLQLTINGDGRLVVKEIKG